MKKRMGLFIGAWSLALVLLSIATPPAFAAAIGTSANWAGYLAYGDEGYQEVQMSWVVPCIDTHATPQGVYAIWAGLGGSGTSNLVQAGTVGEANPSWFGSEQTSYYAFIENTGQVSNPRLKHGGLGLCSTATQSTGEGALLWLRRTTHQGTLTRYPFSSSLAA